MIAPDCFCFIYCYQRGLPLYVVCSPRSYGVQKTMTMARRLFVRSSLRKNAVLKRLNKNLQKLRNKRDKLGIYLPPLPKGRWHAKRDGGIHIPHPPKAGAPFRQGGQRHRMRCSRRSGVILYKTDSYESYTSSPAPRELPLKGKPTVLQTSISLLHTQKRIPYLGSFFCFNLSVLGERRDRRGRSRLRGWRLLLPLCAWLLPLRLRGGALPLRFQTPNAWCARS